MRYFAPDGTDHPTHREQAPMLRCHIAWRNHHAQDHRLAQVIDKTATIHIAKAA